jgi:drug/metabolite transporter (DMT)-like permease
MLQGVAVGFLAYGLFSCADASIKAVGADLPVFEITFFVTLFSFGTFAFGKPAHEHWHEMFRMNRPWLVVARAACGILAGIGGVYAFTTLPLAEAYSLLFLMPAFTTMMSIPILGEKIGWRRWLAVAAGFIGVLLVVRPGFRELHLGQLTAAIAAVFAGLSMIILRTLGRTEKRISLLGVVFLIALVVNGLLMIPVYKPPSLRDFGILVLAGTVGGFGQIAMLAATRLAPVNRIAPAQYSQIVWAIILGIVFFAEFPDRFALVGLALVALSGLFTFLREEQLRGWSKRTILIRNRPP